VYSCAGTARLCHGARMDDARIAAALAQVAAAGFDLAHAFDTRETREIRALPEGRGILIGNSRVLWPLFEAARRDEEDPLEHYVERTIDAAFPDAQVVYAHRKYASEPTGERVFAGRDGSFVPFQRFAVATGLGALAPSRLVVHPTLGPWFALRAIVIVAGARGPSRAPIAQPCRCDEPCARALDAALADPFEWRAWLAVRDACAIREHRYSDEQIQFHYTHAFPRTGK
jgi:Methylmalonic aciduria and homocystinuria type C family